VAFNLIKIGIPKALKDEEVSINMSYVSFTYFLFHFLPSLFNLRRSLWV
jgi:hypothetical protein